METSILKLRIYSRRFAQLVIVLGIFLMGITPINHENDIFWQIRMGEFIWLNHSFPIRDIYSSSAFGSVWTLHEWLPSVIFYLIYHFLGPAYLIIFKSLLVSVTFVLIFKLFNRLKINMYISLFVFALGALVNTRGVWVVFPSLFEYLFLVITLFLLEMVNKDNVVKIATYLSILALIWANSHGSFFLLTALTFFYILDCLKNKEYFLAKALFFPFLASLITPFITPNGYWTFLYPFRISTGSFTSYVSEYQHFWVVWNWNWNDFVHGFSLILMILLAAIFYFARKKLRIYDLLTGVFFTVLALSAVRHVAIFGLVALILVAKYTRVWFGEYRGIFKRTLIKDFLLILLIICSLYFYKTRVVAFGLNFSEDGYPKSIAEMINGSGLKGNMFNHYNYGGYLIWKMPQYRVFVDGRLEMYLGQIGKDYQTIIDASDGYPELIAKYNINFFINYFTDPIILKIEKDPNWVYITNDEQYVLFVKNTPDNKQFIERFYSKDREQRFREEFDRKIKDIYANYFNNLGLEKLKTGDIWGALNGFQHSVNEKADFVTGHLNLARVYIQMESYDDAISEYNIVLSIEPGNELAKANIAKIKKIKERKSIPIW